MSVLVFGRAGKIGLHAINQSFDQKEFVAIESLETGHRKAIHPVAKGGR